MKKVTLLVFLIFGFGQFAQSQNIEQEPVGFDVEQTGIAHGTIDSVFYNSETVGTKRRTLIYTPPGFSEDNTYPVLYLLVNLIFFR